MVIKILCLGNEFISDDSFAKKIAKELEHEFREFEWIYLKDTFELMEVLQDIRDDDKLIVIDVVEELKEVRNIGIDELSENSILSLHDFDSGFLFKLLGENKHLKIIGLPKDGDDFRVNLETRTLLLKDIEIA